MLGDRSGEGGAGRAPLNGSETIMIVDDEQDVLNALRETLANHGYTVIATNDSQEALKIIGKTPRDTALMITDIVMPRMDGRELIKRIKLVNPGTKILAVSGYTKYVAEKEEIQHIDGFLRKPFDTPTLLSTVRRILDAKPKDVPIA